MRTLYCMYEKMENPNSHPRIEARDTHSRIEEAIPPRKSKDLYLALRATKLRDAKMEVVMITALIRIAGSRSIAYLIKGFMNMPVMNPMARSAYSLVVFLRALWIV